MSKQRVDMFGWLNGTFVPWDQCVVHVRSQAVMTGASVFEGIRGYWNDDHNQLYVFRLSDHMLRLQQSAKVMRMKPVDQALGATCLELLAKNQFREDVHIIVVAYVGIGIGFGAMTEAVGEGAWITAVPRPQTKAITQGIHVRTSSWTRIADSIMPPRVKAAANYQNSRLALLEARADGYDNAILINQSGTVSEATGACLFMIRGGEISTPPITAGILESITRRSLIDLVSEQMGERVSERTIDRTELYLADEVFLCGSGQEVTPVITIDRIPIGQGAPGRITREIQDLYFSVARGTDDAHSEWRSEVYSRPSAASTQSVGATPAES